jgi:hypothetical protein
MNKLSKEKRNQLILAVTGILVVLVVIYWGLIGPRNQDLAKIVGEKSSKVAELQRRSATMKGAFDNAIKYQQISEELVKAESDVAVGDYYAWSYDLLRRFKASHKKVEIPSISQPTVTDVDLFSSFPYRQMRLTISGTAYYHDLGTFLADLENAYPHFRVTNLTIEPLDKAGTGEKLSFRLEIVALVKANA